jgi:branched-chain amino acid transport system substrate-binding protein
VGTAFPTFLKRFGKDAEGIMGAGGWNPDLPASKAYFQHHTEVLGKEPDRWASPLTYASLQMLQQAIERVGKIDRPAVIKELQTGTFETILGPIQLKYNTYLDGWFVGQWQDGEYYGIAPIKAAGAREPLVPKPAWQHP